LQRVPYYEVHEC